MTRPTTSAGLLLIAAAAIAVHLPFLPFPFQGDDFSCLDHAARALDEPSHFFDWVLGARLRGDLAESQVAGLFRAVPKLVMMGGAWLFGVNAAPFRLLNIALHVVAMLLVGRLAARRIGNPATPLVASGLFGIGLGSCTSGVVHVTNLTILLATVFLLLAIEAWERGRRRRALVFFVPALLSHEIAVAGLLLLPFLAGAGARWQRLGRPLLAGALVLLALGAALLPAGEPREVARNEIEQSCFLVLPLNPPREETIEKAGLGEGALTGLAARGADAIVRHRLAIGSAFLLASLLAVIAVGRGSARTAASGSSGILLAVAWVYAFLLPVSILMAYHGEVGPLWESGWMQRRYLYIPGIGAALLAASGLSRLWQSRRRVAVSAGVVLCIWVLGMDGVSWLGQRANRVENLRRQSELREELSRRASP